MVFGIATYAPYHVGHGARSDDVAFLFIMGLAYLGVSPEQEYYHFVTMLDTYERPYKRYSRRIDVTFWKNPWLALVGKG
jgi:hypothetical protein